MDDAILTPAADPTDVALRLAAAALIGLAVGIERQWSGQARGSIRFAGMRTFLIIGLTSGTAGLLASSGQVALATVLILGVAASSVAAFVVTNTRAGAELDGTTEAAALAVAGLGLLAGGGQLAVAAGATAVIVFALGEKERLHGLVRRVGAAELQAATRFAVMALVILPLLPSTPYHWMGDFSLRGLWALVLVFAGINFLGYLALRSLGPDRGYSLAGLMGGVVSSTAVTLQFSRRSRQEPEHAVALARGVVAAGAIVPLRLLLITAAFSPAVALASLRFALPPLIVGLGVLATGLVQPEAPTARQHDAESPLNLASSLRMTALFAAAFVLVEWVHRELGSAGVLVSAALLGLTNTDPVTLSMARLGAEGPVELAAKAIAISLLANTLFRLAAAATVGHPTFRRHAGAGLALMAGGVVVGMLV